MIKNLSQEEAAVLVRHHLDHVRFQIINEEPARAARGHKMRTYIKEFQAGE